MKVNQKFLAESFPEVFKAFIMEMFEITVEVAFPDTENFYFMEYQSKEQNTPFPLIYPVKIASDNIFAISFFDIPRQKIPAILSYIEEVEELSEDDLKTLSPFIRRYKRDGIVFIRQLPPSSVLGVSARYFRIINELADSV